MAIRRLRLSPTGPFIGDPGLRVGPGSTGLVFRAHGDSDATELTTDLTVLPDLSEIPVDMVPGYKYDLRLVSPLFIAVSTAVNILYSTYYRTRDFASRAWSAWAPMMNGSHQLSVPDGGGSLEAIDAKFDVSVTARCDMIGFACITNGSDSCFLNNRGTWATISEYVE